MHIYINTFEGLTKRIIKMSIAMVYFYSGIFFLVRAINNVLGRRLTIVTYHRVTNKNVEDIESSLPYLFVSKSSFEAQIKFYKTFYNVIRLSDLNKYKKGTDLPNNSLIITFDDGYEDNYKIAFPILKKMKVPSTIYLTTDYIGTENIVWWDEIYYRLSILLNNGDINQYQNVDEELKNIIQKFSDNPVQLFSELSRLEKTGINRLIDSLRNITRGTSNFIQSNKFMTWEQAISMRRCVEFGSHTCSHVSLAMVDAQRAQIELSNSRLIIRKSTGAKAISFAYPTGHYLKNTSELVKKSGYEYALTLDGGIDDLKNRYALKRINIWEGSAKPPIGTFSRALFAFALSGLKLRK